MPLRERRNLGDAVFHFGDTLPAIAGFYDRHLADLNLNDLTGAAGGAMTARSDGFVEAVRKYQQALVTLHNHRRQNTRGGVAQRVQLEQTARQRYAELQRRFQNEMKPYTVHAGKNRGGPLTSAERGLVLAGQRRRHVVHIADHVEAKGLAKLAPTIRLVGHATLVIDAGRRVNKVITSKALNENWQRQAAIETVGFSFAAMAGVGATQATVAALTFAIGMTPVGWVVAIGIGLTAGYAAATMGDSLGKSAAGEVWDWSANGGFWR